MKNFKIDVELTGLLSLLENYNYLTTIQKVT